MEGSLRLAGMEFVTALYRPDSYTFKQREAEFCSAVSDFCSVVSDFL